MQGVHQRDPHGLRVAAVQRAGVLDGDRAPARRRGARARRRGSACCSSSSTGSSSHLLFQATNGMDLGAVSMMIYGWRERELTLRLLENITGLRMNHNFIRPGGVAADLPDGWEHDVLELCDQVERGVGEYDTLLSENPIWRERTVGVGVITTQQALALNATGPILRSTGFAWDLRRAAAVPRVRRRRLRRDLHAERRRLRPLPDPALRDPRVGQDRAPVRGAHARRATTACRTARSHRRRGRASTSRWKR